MKRLTTKILMDTTLKASRREQTDELFELRQAFAEIETKVKVFEAVVWFPRLQNKISKSKSRGMSAIFRGIKLMTWCCAGRCLLSFSKGTHEITLITGDDEERWYRDVSHVAPNMGPMGIQTIDADWLEAMQILYLATRYKDEINLVDSTSITISTDQNDDEYEQ